VFKTLTVTIGGPAASKFSVASVHQNPATDNPFVAKNQNLYFRGRCIWFDFQKSSSYHKYLDHENTNNENVFR